MDGPAIPSIAQVADRCFEELAAHVEAGGQITVEHLSKLGLLLGRNWAKALSVVDGGDVECFEGEASGRRVFQVKGKSGVYLTFARTYCACQAHYYEVVCKAEAPYCKHQLAARLAVILQRCPVTVVPDATLAQFLLDA
ncbi:ZSWIM7 [Scenedesmus sp. PABB004]|nr:ZSWIM7 [Scenedesmus sp. PABB004]